MKKLMAIPLVICSLNLYPQDSAKVVNSAGTIVSIDTAATKRTVLILGPGLFNPRPSASMDTGYIYLTPTNVLFKSQPTQIAKTGQKVFVFIGVPRNLDNYMIFRNGIYLSSRRFTAIGNSITIPDAVAGDEIEFRKLR